MNIGLILAGGRGTRMDESGSKPKQFMKIDSKPLIAYSLEAFNSHREIDTIVVVCLNEWIYELKSLVNFYGFEKVSKIVNAGKNRRESSYKGVMAVSEIGGSNSVVLIHDAARPFVSGRIISENIKYAKIYGGCDTVIKMQDTILESNDGCFIGNIPDRKNFYCSQTPQSFIVKNILRAHQYYNISKIKPEITDDCGLMLFAGFSVYMADGEKSNIKITSKEDLLIGKALKKN
ncbi:MAG: 2-C-methyl-D-erythritol 4-phosphate cytidylyltransferase [Clostridiales bacterium]|jgi:2-C-methyl-D-erythritol 4-phosphate cytidylyltransferase|nr:2-C-methyl-D-erythritol 4-phosphate cytidylyltransferase [Clostridiales bacterium]